MRSTFEPNIGIRTREKGSGKTVVFPEEEGREQSDRRKPRGVRGGRRPTGSSEAESRWGHQTFQKTRTKRIRFRRKMTQGDICRKLEMDEAI